MPFLRQVLAIGCFLITTNIKETNYENEIKKMKTKEIYIINIESKVEHKILKQNGYSIHYYISGDTSNELIVFLHPAFADHRCFDKQIDFFSKNYRVITIDLLGHGLSKVENAKEKIDFSTEHINSIITIEGHKNSHFVGVSMGTLIAQYYALKYPAKVLSMTLLGGYDINADNKEIAKAQRIENIKWIFKALFSMNAFRRYVASVSLNNSLEQARFYEMASLFTRKSFMVMSGLSNIIKPRENIKREYPLLIISGDKDIGLAKRMSKKWHDTELTSKYYLIKGAGHCANMDKPDEFNNLVADFIKQIGG